MKYKHFKQALLFKVGSLQKFRIWFKYGLGASALYLSLRPVTVGSGRVERNLSYIILSFLFTLTFICSLSLL